MLKHSFRLVKVVDGCQGYTSVVELSTIRKNLSIIHSMAVAALLRARK
jgi:hypothetical protein